jgi:hypothetical protein
LPVSSFVRKEQAQNNFAGVDTVQLVVEKLRVPVMGKEPDKRNAVIVVKPNLSEQLAFVLVLSPCELDDRRD